MPSFKGVAQTVGRARAGTAMAAPLTAPRTSFNGTITGHRAVALVDMSLDDIKAVKAATGATVNDVVLAVAGGALRSYLEDRDELPDSSLLATVPMSVRETSKRETGANKVSALFTRLGTDIEDPLERLGLLAESNRHAKDHAQAISADSLQDWAEFAAPRTFGLAVRAYAGLRLAEKHPVVHNLVISNVPGPADPALLHGRRDPGAGPARPGLPRCRRQRHRHVQQRQGARRDHRLPRVDARRGRPRPALPGRARRAARPPSPRSRSRRRSAKKAAAKSG